VVRLIGNCCNKLQNFNSQNSKSLALRGFYCFSSYIELTLNITINAERY
jgi:hypothetical protein